MESVNRESCPTLSQSETQSRLKLKLSLKLGLKGIVSKCQIYMSLDLNPASKVAPSPNCSLKSHASSQQLEREILIRASSSTRLAKLQTHSISNSSVTNNLLFLPKLYWGKIFMNSSVSQVNYWAVIKLINTTVPVKGHNHCIPKN